MRRRSSRALNAQQALRERTRRRTVLQAYIGERHDGGYDDLGAIEISGQLDQLLEQKAG